SSLRLPRPPPSPLFPYSTLFRSQQFLHLLLSRQRLLRLALQLQRLPLPWLFPEQFLKRLQNPCILFPAPLLASSRRQFLHLPLLRQRLLRLPPHLPDLFFPFLCT